MVKYSDTDRFNLVFAHCFKSWMKVKVREKNSLNSYRYFCNTLFLLLNTGFLKLLVHILDSIFPEVYFKMYRTGWASNIQRNAKNNSAKKIISDIYSSFQLLEFSAKAMLSGK